MTMFTVVGKMDQARPECEKGDQISVAAKVDKPFSEHLR